ncbi:hypothetical protein D3C71_1903280 [compost metagenome]
MPASPTRRCAIGNMPTSVKGMMSRAATITLPAIGMMKRWARTAAQTPLAAPATTHRICMPGFGNVEKTEVMMAAPMTM